MLFRDIYKSQLTAMTGVINKMLGEAFNGSALRLPRGSEKVLLTVAPGLDVETGKTVLYINAMISNFDEAYDATDRCKNVTVGGGKYNKTPKHLWWSSHTRAGVQGIAFTKCIVSSKIFLRFHGSDALSGNRTARAYRVKYGDRNTTIFELVKSEHSYWIDHSTVCAIGHIPMPAINEAPNEENKTPIMPKTANVKGVGGNITKIPVLTSHRNKRKLRSLSELGAAMRETA